MQQIASTLKAPEVEESLDIVFYRPCGYWIASLAARLHLTPNQITALGAAIGIAAGHFFYYRSAGINLIGICLLIISEMMDSADGQLARMTNQFSEYGRFLDGFGDNLKFVSIYVHFALRLGPEIGFVSAFVIAACAGASHSFQSAAADYYRTAFTGFALGGSRKVLKNSRELAERHAALSWKKQPIEKLFVRIYLNYTHQQEMMTASFQKLNSAAAVLWDGTIPDSFAGEYYRRNRPLIKYYNILTTNTRVFVLMAAALADAVLVYFAFDIIVLNLLLASVLLRQSAINRILRTKILDGAYT
ncbi:MAG TPA: CDP-alcohol phosphatidyltransferase family protein [Bacteroidota bacterium]|nr:CDP-alcohol phosphatidyltransferase family protein [Bacteroidota bacterium]